MTKSLPPGVKAGERQSGLSRILDFVASACMFVAGILLVVLIVIFGWLVFGRYVLNNTPTWVEQASLLIIAYITFLGAAVGIRRNDHLSIDFIRDALPRWPKLILTMISNILLIVLGAFMAWQGYGLTITNLDRQIPMIGMTEAWRAAPLALCGVLIAVFALGRLAKNFSSDMRNGA